MAGLSSVAPSCPNVNSGPGLSLSRQLDTYSLRHQNTTDLRCRTPYLLHVGLLHYLLLLLLLTSLLLLVGCLYRRHS